MKKLLLIMTVIFLINCGSNTPDETYRVRKDLRIVSSIKLKITGERHKSNVTTVKISEFTYKKHSYILFNYGFNDGKGIVHDPDCEYCKTLKNQEKK